MPMTVKALAGVLFVLAIYACTSGTKSLQSLQTEPAEQAKATKQDTGASETKPEGQKNYVAIIDFTILNTEPELQGLAREIPQSLTQVFLKSSRLKPVDRQDLEKVLNELSLALSDLSSDENALKVGKLLGAKYILVGSLAKVGLQVKINCRLIETETTEIVYTDSVRGPFESLFDLEVELGSKIEKSLGL